ncbi:hypothetical protein A2Y85_02570 [candidate division WOR-3 bacterium RBG_13_43_14]|uniref:protein-glutamate O-methyltransferase n=1 Tax=candidate division WOR-3 bacterium RBG_13_43_14 TaxID=1802590 RepID=A0A1F4U963_UNCW3|nr:MAG: hypothetical protein A2Y85_02570 [candidate division WOR-3 bacterium RBG_13_43_14]
MENNYQDLLTYIEVETGFRCTNYKERPLKRRLMVRLRALNIENYEKYLLFLKQHPEELKTLLDVLTINLSYFFRNPETFDFIKQRVIPILKQESGSLIFWSAGCAKGEEPYSLAIMAGEAGLLERTTIYATDIDSVALDRAQQGRFQNLSFQFLDAHLKDEYFIPDKNCFVIKEKIRQHVIFRKHDIFEKFPFGYCNLIMCRNVLIYLDRNAQSVIINNFYEQLKEKGFLVLGKVELLIGILSIKRFNVISRNEHVYQKGHYAESS